MITRRGFLKATGLTWMAVFGTVALAACGEGRGTASSTAQVSSTAPSASSASGTAPSDSDAASSSSAAATPDSIVVYFSRAGENYEVGYVEQGNTAVIADMVAAKTGSDAFEIKPAAPYPEDYDECLNVAIAERDSGARPAYSGDVDLTPYKTVYLGYPLWWRDLPMCVYTFLESHDWTGKEIRPFCTHGGSGIMNTASSIAATCAGAEVGEPLSMLGTTAQTDRSAAESAVDAWLG